MLSAWIGAASLAGVVSAGYQTMSPTGQWYGRTFTGLARGSKQLALTYDDGPNDPHTLRLMEVLAKHDVPATFFVIGRWARQRPDVVRDLLRTGHAVGNHTFSHPNLIFASAQRTKLELQNCADALADATGEGCRLFRPPFGGRRPGTLSIARSLGLEPVMWSVTGWDWKGKPAQYIERQVRSQIRGGDVILLHDGSHAALGADRLQTVIATDHLIARCKAEGCQFVTIPQMMGQEAHSSQPSAIR